MLSLIFTVRRTFTLISAGSYVRVCFQAQQRAVAPVGAGRGAKPLLPAYPRPRIATQGHACGLEQKHV